MKICVLGMGYVGVVSAACLASAGHEVVGIDPSAVKVDMINEGKSPIVEKDIGRMIRDQVANARLSASTNPMEAIRQADICFVCVGTPSQANGGIDLTYVRRVCEEIGAVLRHHPAAPVIVIRSTILPGTMRSMVIPTLEEHSGKRAGIDFGVCFNPEFMREGTAVKDFQSPPKTVIGELGSASGDVLAQLYVDIPEDHLAGLSPPQLRRG